MTFDPERDQREPLCVNDLNRTVTMHAWEELNRQTTVFPAVYRMAGVVVRTAQLEGATITKQVHLEEFRTIVDRYLSCFRYLKKDETKPCYPPKELSSMMIHEAQAAVPALRRIVTVPVFDQTGNLRLTSGYDATDGMLLLPDCTTAPVARNPTETDVTEAKRLLLEELLVDFPFASKGDAAAAIALILTPFVRELIQGPTPLHFVEAPSPGSGKGLLAYACLMPGLGPRGTNWIAFPEEEDELRKQITSLLMENRGAVLWDNLGRFLKSATLAKLLTDLEWSDRRLGVSSSVNIPVKTLWVMTGNNPQMSDELVRRVVPIRLVPDEERPEERKGFRHPELRTWAELARADLIWAAHTLVQSWLAAGRPKPPTSTPLLGSFESYRGVIGGILHHVGIEGFLENRERLQAFSDPDTDRWRQFVGLWNARFSDHDTKSAELLPLAEEADIRLSGNDPKGKLSSLGTQLGMRRQRNYGGYRIESGTGSARRMWRLLHNSNGNGSNGNGKHETEQLTMSPLTPYDTLVLTPPREIFGVYTVGLSPTTVPQVDRGDTSIGVDESGRLDPDIPIGEQPPDESQPQE